MELRELIARETEINTEQEAYAIADRILAIPEIARALAIAKDYDAAKDLGPSV